MKTLIYGAGPIGQWLALRLHKVGVDVTLLARGRTFGDLLCNGIRIVYGLAGARTPTLDGLLEIVRQGETVVDRKEVE